MIYFARLHIDGRYEAGSRADRQPSARVATASSERKMVEAESNLATGSACTLARLDAD